MAAQGGLAGARPTSDEEIHPVCNVRMVQRVVIASLISALLYSPRRKIVTDGLRIVVTRAPATLTKGSLTFPVFGQLLRGEGILAVDLGVAPNSDQWDHSSAVGIGRPITVSHQPLTGQS